MPLYFAYGSNLDLDDLARWARKAGERVEPRFVARAYWPDAELAFHYLSNARGGGALDLVSCRGSAVPGVVFEVDLAPIDAKEGVSFGRYERIVGPVLLEDGSTVRATTYRVSTEWRRNEFVEPTADYVDVVERGLRHWSLEAAPFERACRNERGAAWPENVFVYGTLKRGHLRAPLMADPSLSEVDIATTSGRLVDLGEYPGLVRAGSTHASVRGEVWRYSRLDSLFETLDSVEDFAGWDRLAGSMYHRAVIPTVAKGTAQLAWAYLYRGDRGEPIPAGEWCGV